MPENQGKPDSEKKRHRWCKRLDISVIQAAEGLVATMTFGRHSDRGPDLMFVVLGVVAKEIANYLPHLSAMEVMTLSTTRKAPNATSQQETGGACTLNVYNDDGGGPAFHGQLAGSQINCSHWPNHVNPHDLEWLRNLFSCRDGLDLHVFAQAKAWMDTLNRTQLMALKNTIIALKVKQPSGKSKSFLAFTAIDPATGWFECIAIPDATAYTVMEAFHNTWLCRYPRPRMIRFDNGSEFKSVFLQLCENYEMKDKPTSSYNPRSNGIIERVHLVLRDNLATFELNQEQLPEINPFDSFVASASWAIRSSFHSTLQATPGQLVFGRDMLLDLKFRADWGAIKLRKQNMINKGVVRENKQRVPHDFKVGDKVLSYDVPGIIPKMDPPRTGPYEIIQVYTNGTVTIQKGAVSDRVNIRNISPFFE